MLPSTGLTVGSEFMIMRRMPSPVSNSPSRATPASGKPKSLAFEVPIEPFQPVKRSIKAAPTSSRSGLQEISTNPVLPPKTRSFLAEEADQAETGQCAEHPVEEAVRTGTPLTCFTAKQLDDYVLHHLHWDPPKWSRYCRSEKSVAIEMAIYVRGKLS